MPQVQQLSNILPAGNGGAIPPDIRARLLAAQMATEQAAAPKGPYTSRAAGLVSAMTGGLGGLMEGAATSQLMARQQAHANLVADAIERSPQFGQQGAAAAAQAAGKPAAPANSNQASPASTPASGDARDLAIRTIYGEAGGEPAQGQAAVAAVLKNRLASGQYGPDMQSVITAPKQFSLWNQGDPAGELARKLDPSSPAYQKIGSIYDGVMSGQIADPTGGADHYYNPKAASPAWGPQLAQQNDVTIGNHRFVGKAPGQQAAADPSQAPGDDLRSTILAAAAPQGVNPDAPAPNAQPVASNTLPPGVTAAMMGSGTPPAAPASPYGAGPQPMAAPSPDDQSLRDALLAAAAQHDPNTAAAPALPPGALSGQADPGTGNVLPANPPLPPQNPNSPFGGPPQPMTPPAATPPSAMANAMAGQSPAGAMGLSTDHLPGFDNFDQNGDVTQSSTGGAGFTGDFADGPGGQINGNLPAPGYAAGGPAFDPQALAAALSQPSSPAPFTPDPATVAKFNAAQTNGLPVGSSGASQPSSGAGQPSGPLPQMSTQNLPAPGGLAAESGATVPDPTSAIGHKTVAPSTGPDSPYVGISTSPGPRTEQADAPAPGAIQTSAPGLPASMQAQPMGLPGRGGSDPMSAQAFNRSQALAQALQGSGGAQPPQPTPAMLASAMQGGSGSITASPSSGSQNAPQMPKNGPAASVSPNASGSGLLSSIFGGGQQPQAQPSRFPPGSAMEAYDRLLRDPMTTNEEASMIAARMNPQPMKLSQGEGLVGRNPDGSFGNLYTQPALDKYKEGANGSILDSSKGTTTIDPNASQVVEVDAGNGVKVPMRIGRNPDGSPNVTMLTPGSGTGAPVGQAPQPGAPITFGGPATSSGPAAGNQGPATPSAAAQAGTPSPFGPQVDSMVARAGALQAQQAGAKASAEANAKNDVDEVAASRTKLEGLRQSGQDLAQAQAALDSYKGRMPTGPFGQNAIWAQGVANTVGLGDPNQLSNMEIFAKNATKVASQQIKEFTSKGTNLDLETELKNNPGANVSDQSNRILIDHLGRTNQVAQQYENAKQGYYDQNGSLRGFQPAWEQSVSGANAIPLSKFPITTKTIGGQTYSKVLSTDPSGYTWTTGAVQ